VRFVQGVRPISDAICRKIRILNLDRLEIPDYARAIIGSLRFRSRQPELLTRLDDSDWRKVLSFADRTQLTLPLALTNRENLPEWVRSRVENDLAKNAQRWLQLQAVYREAAGAFQTAGIECVVMKGFSHCPRFAAHPCHRWQGDLDLLFDEVRIREASQVALGLGYEPIIDGDTHPTNHLPTLIRRNGWTWRGDHFDPEIPISLELHFAVWDRDTERFGPEGLEQFWHRRRARRIDDLSFMGFGPADELAVASLHLLCHMLRGSLRPSHVYEIAWMLDGSIEDQELWTSWGEQHDASLRRLEAICFAIAASWFDCRLPGAAAEEIEKLPAFVTRWLDIYSGAPLTGRFHPNKDEIWLHWSLLDSTRDRLAILRRRLLPQNLPGPVDTVAIPVGKRTFAIRWRARGRYAAYLASRTWHHFRTLAPTARSAIRWFSGESGLNAQFWRLFLAEGFFDFGMFIFVLLYNLYLLQLGYHEDFIGRVSSVNTAAGIVGTLGAAIALRRFGLSRTMQGAFGLTALFSALRAIWTPVPALLGMSALAGIASSAWPVAFPPAVTALTTEKNRARGFSLISSAGIAIGVIGAQAAGRLPGWLTRLRVASSGVEAYRGALFAACVFVLISMFVVRRVKVSDAREPAVRKFRWPSGRVLRFLAAMLVWNLGTGAFNPFFNVFFARQMGMAVEQIGSIVSVSQIAQIVAILASPLVFRRLGLVRGIASMELATGLSLAGLAAVGGPTGAAVGYVAYMMTQYMSEPGMFTFLMQTAPPGERGSASALNFLVSFGGQAIAAAVAGQMLATFGYPPLLLGAACICGVAALLFWRLAADSNTMEGREGVPANRS
jgi:predicted MFS family arabinose efflux permease